MSEHNKLYEICKLIEYKIKFNSENNRFEEHLGSVGIDDYYRKINVREIIFTPEFMDKFLYEANVMEKYKNESALEIKQELSFGLISNLDNPVDFLYSFIK